MDIPHARCTLEQVQDARQVCAVRVRGAAQGQRKGKIGGLKLQFMAKYTFSQVVILFVSTLYGGQRCSSNPEIDGGNLEEVRENVRAARSYN